MDNGFDAEFYPIELSEQMFYLRRSHHQGTVHSPTFPSLAAVTKPGQFWSLMVK